MKRSEILILIIFCVLLLPSVSAAVNESGHGHDHNDKTEHNIEQHDHDKYINHEGHDDHDDHNAHSEKKHKEIEDHKGHDHDEHAGNSDHTDIKHEETEDHKGHDHDAHSNHTEHAETGGEDKEHEDETSVILTDRAIEFAGLTISKTVKKAIGRSVELPGEIGFNEDRLAHITPRYPGIVIKVDKQLGETVKKGDLLAIVESNESLTKYTISSPISGKIVKKHITPGEFVGEDATLFVIADLSTLWANCDVYAKDEDFVEKGQEILITSVGSDRKVKTKLSYVAPIYNTTTRSMIARAVIPNIDSKWRPGTFITGKISVSTEEPVLVVLRDAVQVLHGETVIFIPGKKKNSFEPAPVIKGKKDDSHVEIFFGLSEGQTYVSKGAFELKAKIVTSALGDHAGHGH